MIQATAEVIRFESKRTRTLGRIGTWLAIAIAPSLLIALLQAQAIREIPRDAIAITSYFLIVQVGTMLGLLLWATPAVGSELEAQTWIYIAIRQHGKVALLLGKFLVAAMWTASASIVSSIGVSIASQFPQPLQMLACLITLSVLASICYASLYVLIGVAIQSRATVVAVVYTLTVEGLLSNIPATINKFTISYRLRSILAEWMDIKSLGAEAVYWLGQEPIWQHIAWLFLYMAITLTLALWMIFFKEFPTGSES